MNNRKNHRLLYFVLGIFLLNASGCGLAPREEVLPDAPVIPSSTVQEYKKAEVMRGDIIDSINIDCTYNAFQTETLNFKISGLRIDHVYVNKGDSVKAGDILADLEMDDISTQIEDCKSNIELLELNITNQDELRQLAVSNRNRLKSLSGYNDQIDYRYNQEISGYDNNIMKLNDSLYIAEERLSKLQEDIKNHQIIAAMDGIISYVGTHTFGTLSDKESSFITIYDPDTMVFVADGKNANVLMPGKKVEVNVDDNIYSAVVITLDQLNTKQSDKKENAVYLQVDNTDNQLQKDDQGEITIVNKELKDVLYLPSSAVHEDNGKTVVYVEDEGGFKSLKEVATGFTADRKVEIISGLKEGDSVILD